MVLLLELCVVYLLIPTSNHNSYHWLCDIWLLYIFWFLHQTTTRLRPALILGRCISFDSYIKPQRLSYWWRLADVVYLLIPTSNHNIGFILQKLIQSYIFWFLHQTTTLINLIRVSFGCISFDSYIKPQLFLVLRYCQTVVYLLIPTSNHNFLCSIHDKTGVVYLLIPTSNHNYPYTLYFGIVLYIFWFLHQTTTCISFFDLLTCCISFDSYIKPQLKKIVGTKDNVVYLLIPTSNHNSHFVLWFTY